MSRVVRHADAQGASASRTPPSDGRSSRTLDRVRILDGIDLRVDQRAILTIVGPSGSGKSSLLRLINRMDEISAGSIDVLGRAIGAWPVRELRRRVAMVFQEPTLLGRSVRGNLELPFEFAGESPQDLPERIERATRQAGLEMDLLDREAEQLSVGQKQRATLARALITEPSILLLDEPTSSLDPPTAQALLRRLRDLQHEQPLTLITVTHRLDEARMLGGDLAVLIEGRIAACGPVAELVNDPPDGPVREFFKAGNHGA